jgi:hypothetical protein
LWVVVPLGVTLAAWAWMGDRRPAAAEPRAVVRIEPRVSVQAVEPAAVESEPEPEPESEPEPDPRLEPATRAARKVLELQASIRATMTRTAYQHRTVIRRDEGVYLWDCSAMMGWFLRRVAPVARGALGKGRPVARDYYRHIARTPTQRPRKGWQRLAHIEDVRPGDVFAWIRPPDFPSRNTGHTGFALEPARPVPELPGAYTLRILDATSLPHQDDTRDPEGDGGIGEGTILFLVDEDGRGVAYGWFGRKSRGVIATDIVFGRISR